MKFEKQPLDLLKQMANASVEAISTRAANKDLKTDWSGIGFSLCGQQMVAPMGQVVEIIHAPNFTFIPRTKDWVLGLANIRGRMLPIYDIEKYFGSKLAGNRSRHRVLVVESEHVYAGLMVSNVFGLKHFPVNSFKQAYQSDGDVFASCIDSTGNDGQSDWLRFQIPLLTQAPEFMDAALQISSHTGASAA
jgi:twitching motility protein PilI